MKTVIIKIVIPEDGRVNHVECQSKDKGIFSPKFEIIEPVTEGEIRQTSGILGSVATAKIWQSGAKWTLKRLGL